MSTKTTGIEEIPVTPQELEILKAKLESLQALKNLCSKIALPVTIVAMLLFVFLQMEAYVVLSIMLAGMFESIAIMDIQNEFKKEFEAIKQESKEDMSEDGSIKDNTNNHTKDQTGGEDE